MDIDVGDYWMGFINKGNEQTKGISVLITAEVFTNECKSDYLGKINKNIGKR